MTAEAGKRCTCEPVVGEYRRGQPFLGMDNRWHYACPKCGGTRLEGGQ